MNKLPLETLIEVTSNMESCRDILNFCLTNSKNKQVCQMNSIKLIKNAIKNKIPEIEIDKIINKMDWDFENANNAPKVINSTLFVKKNVNSGGFTPLYKYKKAKQIPSISPPFSYLNGKGQFQTDFNLMLDQEIEYDDSISKQISKQYGYDDLKWSDIKKSLLHISESIFLNKLPEKEIIEKTQKYMSRNLDIYDLPDLRDISSDIAML